MSAAPCVAPCSAMDSSYLRRRTEHSILCAPTALNSVDYCCLVDSGNSLPLRDCSDNTVDLDKPIVASVVVLLDRCCPSAVTRLVVAIRIGKSVNAMRRRRALSHVGKESLETIAPPIAHGNAKTSVFVEICSRRVVAPRFDALPNTVFGGWIVGVHRTSVRRHRRSMKAAARPRIQRSKSIAKNYQSCPAIAGAIPCRGTGRFCAINNRKPAEFLASKVNEFSHYREPQ